MNKQEIEAMEKRIDELEKENEARQKELAEMKIKVIDAIEVIDNIFENELTEGK